jgi:hypothetical protein
MLVRSGQEVTMAPMARLRRFELPVHQCEVVERDGARTASRSVFCPVRKGPRSVEECQVCNEFVAAREQPLEEAFVCCVATVGNEGDAAALVRVGAVLERRSVVVRDDVDLGRAIRLMAAERVRSLPVVSRDGSVLGVLRDIDALRWLTRK